MGYPGSSGGGGWVVVVKGRNVCFLIILNVSKDSKPCT